LAGRKSLDLAQHADDLAEDGRLGSVDGLVSGIVRQQPRLPVAPLQRLDSGLAVDHGGHDVAVLGVGLLPDDDPLAIRYSGVDHRLTGDPEQEQGAVADKGTGKREDVLDHLLGEDRATGGDAPHERYEDWRGRPWWCLARLPGTLGPARAHLDRARPGGGPAQIALALGHGPPGRARPRW